MEKNIIRIVLILACGLFCCGSIYALELRISADPREKNCVLKMTINNFTESSKRLSFTSSKKYDFVIEDLKGKKIWVWSDGKMFAQALEEIEVLPDEMIEYDEIWDYKDSQGMFAGAGLYRVKGIISSVPDPLETVWEDIVVLDNFNENRSKDTTIRGKVIKLGMTLYFLGKDGIAYHILDADKDIYGLIGAQIEVISCDIGPIEGSVDKEITIKEFKRL